MAEWFVAKNSEMKDGDRRIVTAGQREIGVFLKDGAYYAYSNICLHQGGPACEGVLVNNVVDIINEDRTYEGQKFGDRMHFVCPWHAMFHSTVTAIGARVGRRYSDACIRVRGSCRVRFLVRRRVRVSGRVFVVPSGCRR